MRFYFIPTLIFISFLSLFHAQKISGNWIGILTNPSIDSNQAIPVLLSHQVVMNFSNGTFRIEDAGAIQQFQVSGAIKNKKNYNYVLLRIVWTKQPQELMPDVSCYRDLLFILHDHNPTRLITGNTIEVDDERSVNLKECTALGKIFICTQICRTQVF